MTTFPQFSAENHVCANQAMCEQCNNFNYKWRFVAFDPERLGDRPFSCIMIGSPCAEPEDPRACEEYEESELVNIASSKNEESIEFD